MTKEEAIQAMKDGKKVRHQYFARDEWVTMVTMGQMVLEDGVECSPYEFWRWRIGPSWDIDWFLYNE
jgi:hypothetical protein